MLAELVRTEAFCLVAKDDDAFTYNRQVNRMVSIQEHFMSLCMPENGVAEKRIAATLSMDAKARRRQQSGHRASL